MAETASSSFEIAASKSFMFPVRLYRFDSIILILFNDTAPSRWSLEVAKTASSAFEMAASKSFTFPVLLSI